MIGFVAGLILGIFLTYMIVRTKLKTHIELNKEVAEKNLKLNDEYQSLTKQINDLKINKQSYQEQINILENTQTHYRNMLQDLETQAQTAADIFYKDKMDLAEKNFASCLEQVAHNYECAESEYKQHYLELLDDFSSSYQEITSRQKEEMAIAEQILLDLQIKVDAAVEANKRAELERNEKDFYRLVLSDEDVNEIKHLRSVVPYLRNAEALNKVIWKAYYEKPYTDLIGRVVGNNKVKTGIYKITNLENGMCYVGQAANIAERWRQHIKRGIGAEPLTRNKLYPAMLSIGVENFSFEIIEECSRDQLNDKEDYWQDFFKAKEFGYSIK